MTTQLSLPIAQVGTRAQRVTRMGLGSGFIGADPAQWPRSLETVQTAFDQGVRLFDTAPLYSAGRAEEAIGEALAGIPRDQYVISTKVGRLLDMETRTLHFDYSRDGVLRSLEGSLRRLRTDHVEILHIHDSDHHMEDALAEAYPTLEELRRQGVVRAIGAGMNQWQALLRFAQEADFDCFLLAGRYTLLEQMSLAFLALCHQRGIGLLLGGVYNTGILVTGAVPGARYQYAEAPVAILDKTRAIEAICARHGVALAAAAQQFVLAHPAVAAVVVGAVAPEEVRANVAAFSATIPPAFWTDLREAGLIDAAAPLP